MAEYHKYAVEGTKALPAEVQGGALLAGVQAVVCHVAIKPWTVDHLHLTFDTDPIGDGEDNPSIRVLKVPASVKLDTYLEAGDSSVVDLTGAMDLLLDVAPLTVNDLLSLVGTPLTESQRRFAAGDRLVVLLQNFSREGTEGAGTGSGSGANLDVGFENAALSWLGRTPQL